jgi:hypothetical protein
VVELYKAMQQEMSLLHALNAHLGPVVDRSLLALKQVNLLNRDLLGWFYILFPHFLCFSLPRTPTVGLQRLPRPCFFR